MFYRLRSMLPWLCLLQLQSCLILRFKPFLYALGSLPLFFLVISFHEPSLFGIETEIVLTDFLPLILLTLLSTLLNALIYSTKFNEYDGKDEMEGKRFVQPEVILREELESVYYQPPLLEPNRY